jgi:hypothetical protein
MAKTNGTVKANKEKNGICTIEGCNNFISIISLGYCNKHYQRLREHGDPIKILVNEPGTGNINCNGYRRITVDGESILEHRHFMEQHLGRKLQPGENIHHINGCKTDNRLSNLELWSTTQPSGKRISDLIIYAKEILKLYETKPSMQDWLDILSV